MDYAAYPKNWKERVARILSRAKHRCEHCRLANYAVGYRTPSGEFVPLAGNLMCDAAGEGYDYPINRRLTWKKAQAFVEQYNDCSIGKRKCDCNGNRWFAIMLTVAHLDHDEENHDVADERLAALCQKCHFAHDRADNARRRLRRRTGQLELL